MTESKNHKLCKMKCKSKLAGTHDCKSEVPNYKDGLGLFDLQCPSIDDKKWKSCVVECEVNSSKLQKQENFKQGMAWQNLDLDNRVFFQITHPSELNVNKLKKNPNHRWKEGL